MRLQRTIFRFLVVAIIPTAVIAIAATYFLSADDVTITSLAEKTHFHGISIDAKDPSQLYLATHRGLFRSDAAGNTQLIARNADDCMGIATDPGRSSIVYASGRGATGDNLGFLTSDDGGWSWRKLSEGIRGPVAFRHIDFSKDNTKAIYGVGDDIQRSTDGGRTWMSMGPTPEGLIDFAAGRDPETLYAATRQGLMRSADGGRSWRPVQFSQGAATAVQVTDNGEIFAFIAGTGLVRAPEQGLSWTVANGRFGRRYLFHLAVASTDDERLYAIAFDPLDRSQSVVTSGDGGQSWSPLGPGGASRKGRS